MAFIYRFDLADKVVDIHPTKIPYQAGRRLGRMFFAIASTVLMTSFFTGLPSNPVHAEDLPVFLEAGEGTYDIIGGIDALDLALKLESSSKGPAEFGRLGAALAIEGQEKGDFAILMDAVRTLQRAIATLAGSEHRHQIALIRNNLGHALALLGDLQGDDVILREAVRVLEDSFGLIDKRRETVLWAVTRQNLAFAEVKLAAATDDMRALEDAIDGYGQALDIFDEREQSKLVAVTRRRLAVLTGGRHPVSIVKAGHTDGSLDDADPDDVDLDDADEDEDEDEDDMLSSEIEETLDPENEDPAVFEVVLSGSLQFAAVTSSRKGDGYAFEVDPETDIAARVETDDGINYGAVLSLDVDDLSDTTAVVRISGGFGEVRLGQDGGAEDDMFVGGGDAQAGTGGIDGDGANLVDVALTGSESATKVSYYTPRKRGVQLGASFTPDTAEGGDGSIGLEDLDNEGRFEKHWGLGINWTGGLGQAQVITSAVGSFGEAVAGDDLQSYSIGSSLAVGRLLLAAGYTAETGFNERDLLNFGITYGFDPWFQGLGESRVGAGVAFLFPDKGKDSTVFALSGDIAMSQGLKLLGDISYNSRDGQTPGDKASSVSSVVAIGVTY